MCANHCVADTAAHGGAPASGPERATLAGVPTTGPPAAVRTRPGLCVRVIQAPAPPPGTQITVARVAAGAAGMTIETKSSTPSSAEILNWATVFGIALALGILAMTIGLLRSETAR